MSWLRAFTFAIGVSCTGANTALLVIDVQKCFIGDGSLGVPAPNVVPNVNKLIGKGTGCLFDDIVYSQDFHPKNHISFASSHGLEPFAHIANGPLPLLCIKPESGLTKDAACCPKIYVDPSSVNCSEVLCPKEGWNYTEKNPTLVQDNPACTKCRDNPDSCFPTTQEMWTDHCLQTETGDSGFPSDLKMGDKPMIVQKGMNVFVDAYSAFKDNSKQVETKLRSELQGKKIEELIVVGIATDFCVKESVRDAIDYGYNVTVIKDATAAVQGNQDNFNAAVKAMEDMGAQIKTMKDIMDMECPALSTAIPSTTLGFLGVVGCILPMVHSVFTKV